VETNLYSLSTLVGRISIAQKAAIQNDHSGFASAMISGEPAEAIELIATSGMGGTRWTRSPVMILRKTPKIRLGKYLIEASIGDRSCTF
jgi:hypothetical protein